MFVCCQLLTRKLDILLFEESMKPKRTTSTPLAKGAVAHTDFLRVVSDPIPYRSTKTATLMDFWHQVNLLYVTTLLTVFNPHSAKSPAISIAF
jgi:hypothetical protein